MRVSQTTAVLGLLATASSAQFSPHEHELALAPIHSQAVINDARSHGVVGDRWLSLREAILLNNRTLDEFSLSQEERNQLQGFGSDIAFADIDANAVPVLTFERDLPIIDDTPHGLAISGSGGRPTIDMRDFRGIVAISDFVDFRNLKLVGGDVGIHIRQLDTLFGTLIEQVEFEGQGSAGIRLDSVSNRPLGAGRLLLNDLLLRGLPTAIQIDDSNLDRTTQIDIAGAVVIENCRIGVDVLLGAGGQHTLLMEKMDVRGAEHAFRVRRVAAGTSRDLLIEGRYLRLCGSQSAFAVEGHPSAQSQLILQLLDVTSPRTAMSVGPLGSDVDLLLQEFRIDGDAAWTAGAGGRIEVENGSVRSGRLTLGSAGSPVSLGSAVIDAVATDTTGNRQVVIADSRIEGGSLQGTATAPILVQRSYVNGTTIGSNVTLQQNLPDAPLGSFEASPLEPAIGSSLTLQTDLPPRLGGVYLFGRTLSIPAVLPGDHRLYCDLTTATILTQLPVQGQQAVVLPIPNAPLLVGLDLFFHLAVGPQPGVSAPALWFPPGRRVKFR